MSDRLTDRLAELRGDAARTLLPPASDIRRRGSRRSMIQVGGSAIAVAAVATTAIVWSAPGEGPDGGDIAHPSPNTTTGAPLRPVTPASLLDPDELPVSDPTGGPWSLVADGATKTDVRALPDLGLGPMCATSPVEYRDSDFIHVYSSDGTGAGEYTRASEALFADSDPASADTRSAALTRYFLDCGGSRTGRTWSLTGAVDGGTLVELVVPENLAQSTPGGYLFLAVAHMPDVTVAVTLSIIVPEGIDPDGITTMLHDAMAKICAQTGATCPDARISAVPRGAGETDPSADPTIGGLVPADLLDLTDLPTFDDQLPWDTAQDSPGGTQLGHVCWPTWRDLGATDNEIRNFTGEDPFGRAGHQAEEVVAQFGDETAATAAMSAFIASINSCTSNPDALPDTTVEELQSERSTAEIGQGWLVSYPSEPGARTMIYTGILQVGARTALVTMQYIGNGDLNPQPFLDLLATVGAQIGPGA